MFNLNGMETLGYIGLSRVKGADGLLLSEILAPMLFRQGPLPGPSLLIDFLNGRVAEEDLEARWNTIEENKRSIKTDLATVKWECCVCKEEKTYEHYTECDSAHYLAKYKQLILERGSWRTCLDCSRQQNREPRKGTAW